jgi:hypothetical protein
LKSIGEFQFWEVGVSIAFSASEHVARHTYGVKEIGEPQKEKAKRSACHTKGEEKK